jgi:hypothetical protein
MSDTPETSADQTAAFAKLWSDACTRLMQAAMASNPETAPPEVLRQIRGGLMQALAQSWEEFLRSPQFLEGMKQTMEQAVAFRNLSTEFLTKTRHATEGVAQEDMESLHAALGQMQSRLARQMEALSAQVSRLEKALGHVNQGTERMDATGRGRRAKERRRPKGRPAKGEEPESNLNKE